MLFNKIKTLAQVIGFATIAFLALNGGLAMLNGDLAWGATLSGIIAPASAQAPQGAPMLAVDSTTTPPYINYQGTLRDAEGNPLSGTFDMTFRIYDDVAAPIGSELWSEEHISVTVRSGHFSVLLGDNTPGGIPQTHFLGPDRFIGVTVHPYDEMVPRQRFASVPYAITADHVSSLNASDGDPQDAVFVDNDGRVGIGTTSPSKKLEVAGDGKFTGGDIRVWYGDKAITIRQDGDSSYISNKENFVDNGAASNGWLILNGSAGVRLRYGDSDSSGADGLVVDSSGNVAASGDISWSGHLSSLSVSGVYKWEWDADNGQNRWYYDRMQSSSNSICFLVLVELEDIETQHEQAGCRIMGSGGFWWIGAKADGDSNAWCRARCLNW